MRNEQPEREREREGEGERERERILLVIVKKYINITTNFYQFVLSMKDM